MNRDLFQAILALDAYNRGYGQRIVGLDTPTFDENGNATSEVKIGNATITRDSSSLRAAGGNRLDVPADFYAIAYEWGGETIISYRGTDGLNDILTGWTTGAGWTDQAQANLANDNHPTNWRNAA